MKTTIVLICHGSRDPKWRGVFESLTAALQQENPQEDIALCYMEIAAPTLMDLIQARAKDGLNFRVRVLPLFMAGGGHVDHDIPEQIAAVREAFPELDITMQRPVGESPIVVSAIGNIVRELCENS